ncbi:hypothetical protein BN946_scf184868.g8 [Trametes cinnabarina]|uniref:Uncharacterized protein n=1 Tax=Pycnoporus cinnabarinus TaxID=5643 RepID=A0A060SWI1_PYCCI|nr:hypothetical protein BN946_scf184868.g8 [Trametes cinnabarina]
MDSLDSRGGPVDTLAADESVEKDATSVDEADAAIEEDAAEEPDTADETPVADEKDAEAADEIEEMLALADSDVAAEDARTLLEMTSLAVLNAVTADETDTEANAEDEAAEIREEDWPLVQTARRSAHKAESPGLRVTIVALTASTLRSEKSTRWTGCVGS